MYIVLLAWSVATATLSSFEPAWAPPVNVVVRVADILLNVAVLFVVENESKSLEQIIKAFRKHSCLHWPLSHHLGS